MKCCCVPHCKNGRVLKYTKQIKFYFFPKAFDQESASRRSKWIKAVNKINPNGSAWEPRQYTQICSQHFVNNTVSEDPDSPSYVPTLRLSQTVVVAYNHVRPKSAQTSSSNTTLTASASSSSISTISPKKLRQHSVTKLSNNSNNNNDVFQHPQQSQQHYQQQQQQMILSSSEHQNQMNRNLLLTDENTRLIALQTSANINRLKPTARWGHTMTVTKDQMVLLVGGQGEKDVINKDSLWKLDLADGQWSVVDSFNSGNRVDGRMGHVCVYEPVLKYLYMHGGARKNRWFNDVHAFDVHNNRWQIINTVGIPTPKLSYHCCVAFNYQLWFFGGTKPSLPSTSSTFSMTSSSTVLEECTDDVYVLDCLEKRWQKMAVQGKKPKKRSGHSGTLVNDKMVVFGGWNNPTCFNDVFILDLIECEWIQPEITGPPPSPRSWHSSCALGTDQIVIHGGFNSQCVLDDLFVLSVGLLTWTRLQLQPRLPRRTGHTLICLPYHHENGSFHQILAFGGGDNDGGFYSDLVNIMLPFV